MTLDSDIPCENNDLRLTISRHAKFFKRTLQVLPGSQAIYDTQRITIAYFALSGLDLLDRLDMVQDERQQIIDWLYHAMIAPSSTTSSSATINDDLLRKCGFRGSAALKLSTTSEPSHAYDHGHVAMTYTAVASLVLLGDDLARLDRRAIVAGVAALQLPDGSYKAALQGGENDMRFLYCASALCSMLDDWSGMDRDSAVNYVVKSVGYDGGIGQGPGLEAHGGSTYCAVAALTLMGRLDDLGEARLTGLRRWCLARQGEGFQGRPNKPEDTCYSFWVGSTLHLLDIQHLADQEANRRFVLSTQDPVTGGLAKWPDSHPDPLHTYLGLSGLALAGEPDLQLVDPSLNMSKRALRHLRSIQETWS